MSSWIPAPSFMVKPSAPFLLDAERVGEFRAHVARHDGDFAAVDVSVARSSNGLLEAVRGVLAVPAWCGNSWDSIDDAAEEIEAELDFPYALCLLAFDVLLVSHPALALETVVRMSELQQSFSANGNQLMVVFVGRCWLPGCETSNERSRHSSRDETQTM